MNRDSWLTPFDSKLDSDFFKSSNMNSRTESRIESKFESRIESLLDDHRQRLRLPWSNHHSIFDDHMFDIGNQIASMQREIEETFRRFQNHEFSSSLTSNNSLKPLSLTNFSNVHNSSSNFSSSLSLTPYIEAHTDVDGRETGKYTMNIPIGGIISPEDLRISLKDHVMTIEAKKERQEGNSKTYQEFHRKFTLPPSVDPRDVKSVLTPEGTLKIEAPLPRRAIEAQRTSSQLIPIHREY